MNTDTFFADIASTIEAERRAAEQYAQADAARRECRGEVGDLLMRYADKMRAQGLSCHFSRDRLQFIGLYNDACALTFTVKYHPTAGEMTTSFTMPDHWQVGQATPDRTTSLPPTSDKQAYLEAIERGLQAAIRHYFEAATDHKGTSWLPGSDAHGAE